MIHVHGGALHCPMQSIITFMFQAGCGFHTATISDLAQSTSENRTVSHNWQGFANSICWATPIWQQPLWWYLGFSEVKALSGFAGSFKCMRKVNAYLFTTFKTVKYAYMKPRWSVSSCSKTDVKLISGRAWIKYHTWIVQFSPDVFNAL